MESTQGLGSGRPGCNLDSAAKQLSDMDKLLNLSEFHRVVMKIKRRNVLKEKQYSKWPRALPLE